MWCSQGDLRDLLARKSRHVRGVLLVAAVVAAGGCEGLTDAEPDPHLVDVNEDPPQLQESMVGARVDLNHAYDLWTYASGMFAGDMVAVGRLRFTLSTRRVGDNAGVSGGFSGGRSRPGPTPPWYSYLQTAVASADRVQQRILDGDFEQIEDPPNSPEVARVSVYKGFAMTWLADMYCNIAFLNQGPLMTSEEAYRLAADQFEVALQAANAEPAMEQAALIGLARVHRLVGEEQAAVSFAEQVDPEAEFLATYSSNTVEQQNHIWFRTWSFGEHSIAPGYRGLTVDDSDTPDPRVELELNPVAPRGSDDDVYAPWKASTAGTPLRIATGVEAQFIVAEALLNENPDRVVEIINEIREQRGLDTEWSPAGEGPNEIRDKLLEERRRTLFLEGTRMGDVRLYLDKYGLNFFHQEIPQGVSVSDETCFPLPSRERENNPGLSG